MRTDVKIGLFLGVAALLLAAWFYWPVSSNRTVPVGETGRPVGVADRSGPARTGPTVEPLTPAARPSPTVTFTPAPTVVVPLTPVAPAHRPAEPVAAPSMTASMDAVAPITSATTPPAPAPVSAEDRSVAPLVAPTPAPESHATPEVAGAAEIGRAAPLTVVVKSGQTLEQIADQYYKDGDKPYDQVAMVKLLRQANPQVASGKRLRAGTRIKIPDPGAVVAQPVPSSPSSATPVVPVTPVPAASAAPAAAVPSLATVTTPLKSPSTQSASVSIAGAREYKVQRGDTLYSIATRQLGSGKRWSEIRDLNTVALGGKPEGLKPGQVLRLPG